jgi:hypothetical protein
MTRLTGAVLCARKLVSEQSLFGSAQPWKASIEDGDALSSGCQEYRTSRGDFA